MVHWVNLAGGKKGAQLDPARAYPSKGRVSLDSLSYFRKRAWELWMARTLHREHITVADPPLPDLPPEEPTAGARMKNSSTFCLSALLSASRRLLFVQGAACLP